MKPTIQQLVIKRFRSVPSERLTFDNPTIFVGRNGSGKSNLVSAFSFLAEAMASPLQAVFDKAGAYQRSAIGPPATVTRQTSVCAWISAN